MEAEESGVFPSIVGLYILAMTTNVFDRVRESSTTTGTGDITLAGAIVGFQSFASVVSISNQTYYCIQNTGINEWEVGLGTLTGSTTLQRNTVLSSSNANALVSFSAGVKDVFITAPASQLSLLGIPSTFTHAQTIQAASGEATTIQAASNADALDIKDSGGVLRTAFDSNGYGLPFLITWLLSVTPQGQSPTSLTTGTDVTNHVTVVRAGKIVDSAINAKTGPVGSALIIDILKSTDGGSTWTSIWNVTPSNRLQIASGASTGSQTSFDVTTVARGDLLRIDIAQVGSTTAGHDVTVELLLLVRNQV